MGQMRNSCSVLVAKPEEKRLLGRAGVKEKIMLILMLEKYGGKGWTGFIWLGVKTSGGLS
jgi:hypothetical protein